MNIILALLFGLLMFAALLFGLLWVAIALTYLWSKVIHAYEGWKYRSQS